MILVYFLYHSLKKKLGCVNDKSPIKLWKTLISATVQNQLVSVIGTLMVNINPCFQNWPIEWIVFVYINCRFSCYGQYIAPLLQNNCYTMVATYVSFKIIFLYFINLLNLRFYLLIHTIFIAKLIILLKYYFLS